MRMPAGVAQDFSSFGTRQSFIARRMSFQTRCLFQFLSGIWISIPHLRANRNSNSKLNFGYSVVKHLTGKSKRAMTFKFSRRELFASPLLKQFPGSTTLSNFMFRERKRCRSRCFKSFYRGDLSRPVSVDNPSFQNWRTNLPTDFH